jgi:hypothetical protein
MIDREPLKSRANGGLKPDKPVPRNFGAGCSHAPVIAGLPAPLKRRIVGAQEPAYGECRLEGFQPGTSQAADFVRLDQAGGDTTVAVNADGAGNRFTPAASLLDISGVSVEQLVADGNLALA